ncbi:MAG: hypothetical protein R3247_13330 [Rhodothermales bacterium]|nr:hypothetical protein [Rhodothermales bacterium]
MNFVNLTPHTTEVLDADGETITTVKPSGIVGLAAGDPPDLLNVPEPEDGTVYIVLPALTEADGRDDLVAVEIEDAQRSRRGNVQRHVCHWTGTPA